MLIFVFVRRFFVVFRNGYFLVFLIGFKRFRKILFLFLFGSCGRPSVYERRFEQRVGFVRFGNLFVFIFYHGFVVLYVFDFLFLFMRLLMLISCLFVFFLRFLHTFGCVFL